MKPTPTLEMIDAYTIAKDSADRRLHGFHNLGRHFILDGVTEVWFMASDDYEVGHAAMMAQLERLRVEAALSAALSVQPAAAVVGGPVGYVSTPELVNLKMGVSCVDLFREPQPGGIDFAPVYAAPSAPDGWQPIETAPRDGTRVLLWTTTRNPEDQQYVDYVLDGEHVEEGQIGYFSGQEWVCERIGHPSHWRKLPAPPALGGKP